MFNFRFHKGSFNESMQTKVQFDELFEVLDFCSEFFDCLVSNIFIQYYTYDSRLGKYCYLVSYIANGLFYPIGFLWEERS